MWSSYCGVFKGVPHVEMKMPHIVLCAMCHYWKGFSLPVVLLFKLNCLGATYLVLFQRNAFRFFQIHLLMVVAGDVLRSC